MRFQKASTALTVTLKDVPAICVEGDPDLPLAVPGAIASPGASVSNFAKAAGNTLTVPERSLVSTPLVQLIVMSPATVCERLVKVATPLVAVRLVVPWSVPLPPERAAVTTVVLSLLRKLPN